MGYRYGEHKYGEGLYSRWPDWWHDRLCLTEIWTPQDCVLPAFAETPAEVIRWRSQAADVTIWADDPAKIPHPEQRPTRWRKTL